jgi:hypothetical protein
MVAPIRTNSYPASVALPFSWVGLPEGRVGLTLLRALLPDVILQGETVLYSYGKCPRYIVATRDSAIAG